MPLLRTTSLSKVYRTDTVETTALNAVDITIEQGDFVAIMGPSGCGKSTLLNILGLLDSPSNGHYFVNGEDVSNYNERKRAEVRKNTIGFVFQSFNLIDELTVEENIELPLIYTRMGKTDRKIQVDEVMKRMNIAHRAKHFPQQLSGGQQQRVAIARAVVNAPKLILADEPTGNLDSTMGEEVMNLLLDLNKAGTTVIIVTHSVRDAGYAQRTINLLDGKVVESIPFKHASV
ncbi:MAG: ABC transporter ATP-binding protein [Flavobacteriales bacterium]|jgi:putative ABC transport system ATP-binding protein|nr:ABC transporter ATP-binding protein [Flavobacteriales bacterium]HOZ41406.1 ABC transporter ATP-binding protein [Flavobacteriales bacterium]